MFVLMNRKMFATWLRFAILPPNRTNFLKLSNIWFIKDRTHSCWLKSNSFYFSKYSKYWMISIISSSFAYSRAPYSWNIRYYPPFVWFDWWGWELGGDSWVWQRGGSVRRSVLRMFSLYFSRWFCWKVSIMVALFFRSIIELNIKA